MVNWVEKLRIIDGDTVDADGNRIRLSSIDTPETGGRKGNKFQVEQAGADEATEAVRRLARYGIKLEPTGDSGAFGRDLSALVTGDGRNVGEALVSSGLAEPYAANTTDRMASLDVSEQFGYGVDPELADLRERARDELRATAGRGDPEASRYAFKKDKRHWSDRAWDRGVDNTQAMLYSFSETMGSLFGVDIIKDWGEEGVARNMLEAMDSPAQIESYEDVDSVMDGLVYIGERIVENAPQLGFDAVAAVGTGGTAVLGRAALAGIGKQFVKKSGGDILELGKMAGKRGGQAMIGAQMVGEARMQQMAEGEDNPLAAISVGAFNAALESYGISRIADGLFTKGKKMETLNDLGKHIGKTFGVSTLAEGMTEFGQELTNQMAIKMLKGGDYELDGAQLLESLFAGAAAGGGTATITSTLGGGASYLVNRGNENAALDSALNTPDTPDGTEPELPADKQAQVDAVADPESGKDVAYANDGFDEQDTSQVNVEPTGRGNEAVAADTPEKAKAAAQLVAEDRQSEALGMTEDKTDIADPATAVATITEDKDGNVIAEELSNPETAPAVKAKAEAAARPTDTVRQATGEEIVKQVARRKVETEQQSFGNTTSTKTRPKVEEVVEKPAAKRDAEIAVTEKATATYQAEQDAKQRQESSANTRAGLERLRAAKDKETSNATPPKVAAESKITVKPSRKVSAKEAYQKATLESSPARDDGTVQSTRQTLTLRKKIANDKQSKKQSDLKTRVVNRLELLNAAARRAAKEGPDTPNGDGKTAREKQQLATAIGRVQKILEQHEGDIDIYGILKERVPVSVDATLKAHGMSLRDIVESKDESTVDSDTVDKFRSAVGRMAEGVSANGISKEEEAAVKTVLDSAIDKITEGETSRRKEQLQNRPTAFIRESLKYFSNQFTSKDENDVAPGLVGLSRIAPKRVAAAIERALNYTPGDSQMASALEGLIENPDTNVFGRLSESDQAVFDALAQNGQGKELVEALRRVDKDQREQNIQRFRGGKGLSLLAANLHGLTTGLFNIEAATPAEREQAEADARYAFEVVDRAEGSDYNLEDIVLDADSTVQQVMDESRANREGEEGTGLSESDIADLRRSVDKLLTGSNFERLSASNAGEVVRGLVYFNPLDSVSEGQATVEEYANNMFHRAERIAVMDFAEAAFKELRAEYSDIAWDNNIIGDPNDDKFEITQNRKAFTARVTERARQLAMQNLEKTLENKELAMVGDKLMHIPTLVEAGMLINENALGKQLLDAKQQDSRPQTMSDKVAAGFYTISSIIITNSDKRVGDNIIPADRIAYKDGPQEYTVKQIEAQKSKTRKLHSEYRKLRKEWQELQAHLYDDGGEVARFEDLRMQYVEPLMKQHAEFEKAGALGVGVGKILADAHTYLEAQMNIAFGDKGWEHNQPIFDKIAELRSRNGVKPLFDQLKYMKTVHSLSTTIRSMFKRRKEIENKIREVEKQLREQEVVTFGMEFDVDRRVEFDQTYDSVDSVKDVDHNADAFEVDKKKALDKLQTFENDTDYSLSQRSSDRTPAALSEKDQRRTKQVKGTRLSRQESYAGLGKALRDNSSPYAAALAERLQKAIDEGEANIPDVKPAGKRDKETGGIATRKRQQLGNISVTHALRPFGEMLQAVSAAIGFKAKLHIATPSDVPSLLADGHITAQQAKQLESLGGPAFVAFEGKDSDTHGVIIMPDAKRGRVRDAQTFLQLGHEFGHAVFASMSAEYRNDMRSEFAKANPDLYSQDDLGYKEWFADQVAAWAKNHQADSLARKSTPKATRKKDETFDGFLERAASRMMKTLKAINSFISKRFGKRFELNPLVDAFLNSLDFAPAGADGVLNRGYDTGAINQVEHWSGLENRKLIAKTKAAAKNLLSGSGKVSGLFRTVHHRIMAISPELADLLYQDAQTKKDARAWMQEHVALRRALSGDFNTLHTSLGEKRFNAGWKELRGWDGKKPISADAKRIRRFVDEMNRNFGKAMPTAGFRKNMLPEAFDHPAILRDRGAFIDMLEQSGFSSMEAQAVTASILDNEGVPDFAIAPGQAVSMHTTVNQVLARIDPKLLQDKGYIIDDPSAVMEHYIQTGAKRAAWEKIFGGFIKPDGVIFNSDPMRIIQRQLEAHPQAQEEYRKATENLDIYDRNLTPDDRDRQVEKLTRATFDLGAKYGLVGKGGEVYSPNAKFHQIVDKLPAHDRLEVYRLLDGMMGRLGRDMPQYLRTMNDWATLMQTVTVLMFSGVASLPDLAGGVIRGKGHEAVSDWVASLKDVALTRKQRRDLATEFGIISNDLQEEIAMRAMGVGYESGWPQKISHQFFKYNGQRFITEISRRVSTGVAVRFLARHANSDSAISAEYLDELNVSAQTIRRWVAAGMPAWSADQTPEMQKVSMDAVSAVSQFVDESVVNPNRAESTLWGTNPYMKLIWALKQFFYSYGKTILLGMARNSKQRWLNGQRLGAAMPFVIGGLFLMPLAAAGMELRELIKSLAGTFEEEEKTDKMGAGEYAVELFERAGGWGPLEILGGARQAAEWDRSPAVALLGPTASMAEHLYMNLWVGGKDGEVDRRNVESAIRRMVPIMSQNRAWWDASIGRAF